MAPPVTSGLVHHYDARTLGFADEDPVDVWPDLAGTDDLEQATGANQPLFKEDQFGPGLPSVRFDGTDDIMVAGTAADFLYLHDGTGASVFVVGIRVSQSGVATSVCYMATMATTALSGLGFWFGESSGAGADLYVGITRNATVEVVRNDSDVDAVTIPPNAPAVLSLTTERDTGVDEMDVWQNGADVGNVNDVGGAPSGSNSANGLQVGAANLTSGTVHSVEFGELLIYDRVLTTQERIDTENYLLAAWGAGPFPDSHDGTVDFGTETVTANTFPSNLDGTVDFGSPVASSIVTPASFDLAVDFGTSVVVADVAVTPPSLDLSVDLGTETVTANALPSSLDLAVDFGTETVVTSSTLTPSSLDLAVDFGSVDISAAGDVNPQTLTLDVVIPTPTVDALVTVTPARLDLDVDIAEITPSLAAVVGVIAQSLDLNVSFGVPSHVGTLCVQIATGEQYQLTDADEGFSIQAQVVATNAVGETTAASQHIGPVQPAPTP